MYVGYRLEAFIFLDDVYGLLVVIEYVDDNVGDIVVEAELVVKFLSSSLLYKRYRMTLFVNNT